MTLRSLVIDSNQLRELRLDGPALCIQKTGKSRQWFPLRRISQIICFGIPDAVLSVLLLVAHRGIPITFFNQKGTVIAQLIHPGALPHPLAHWLEAVDGDPAMQQVYDIWLENQLRHTYGLIGCIAGSSGASAKKARAQLDKIVRAGKCQSVIDEAQKWFEGLLRSRIQLLGVQRGLPANSAALARIADDLLEAGVILSLTWLAVAIRKEGALPKTRLVAFFEGVLSKSLNEWLSRVFAALSNDLERLALNQDTSYPRG